MRQTKSLASLLFIFSFIVCKSQTFVEQIELDEYDGNSYEAAEYIILKPGFEVNASTDGSFSATVVTEIPVNFNFDAIPNDPVPNRDIDFTISWEELWSDGISETGYDIEVSKDPTFNTVDYSYDESDATKQGNGLDRYYYTIAEEDACKGEYYARMRSYFIENSVNKHSRWVYLFDNGVPNADWELSHYASGGSLYLKIDWTEGYYGLNTHIYVSTTENFSNIVHEYHPPYYGPFYTSLIVDPQTTYYIKLVTTFCYGYPYTYYDESNYSESLQTRNSPNSLILATHNNSELKVYPNSFEQIINVDFPHMTGSYNVVNTNGQGLMAGSLSRGENGINLSGLESGIYVLIINSKNQKAIRKKIIKK